MLESGFWYAEQLLLFPLNMKLLRIPEVWPCTLVVAKPRCVGSTLCKACRAAAVCPLVWREPSFHSHVGESLAVCVQLVSPSCSPFNALSFLAGGKNAPGLVAEALCCHISLSGASPPKGECSVWQSTSKLQSDVRALCRALFRPSCVVWVNTAGSLCKRVRRGGGRRSTQCPT